MNLVRRMAQQVTGGGLSIADLDRMMDSQYGSPTYTGKTVSPSTALAISALWSCISVRSDDIATLPLMTWELGDIDPDTQSRPRTLARTHYLWDLLQSQANPEMTAFRFKQLMQVWVDLWGNAIAEVEISGRGQVTALWPWRPDRVTISRDDSGELQYTYKLKAGKTFTLPHTRIFHLRGMGTDGLTGLSPIEVHKQTFGLSMAMTEHGARYFSTGARPLGILEHPEKLSPVAYNRIKTDWSKQHEGLENAHRVAILEEGLKWHEVGANAVDAQYIESQKLTNEDIARIYKVPGQRIGITSGVTNSTAEELALQYITYSLMPIGENWRQEVMFALLSPREHKTITCGFNYRKLLQGDHESMGKFIAVLRQWGLANADEIRDEFLDWNPQPDGIGKKYWTPVNMAPEGVDSMAPPAPAPGKSNNNKVPVPPPPVKPNGALSH